MKKPITLDQKEVDAILSLPADEIVETLRAIVLGEADALVIKGNEGPVVYTLKDAHQPYRVMIEKMSEGAGVLDNDGKLIYSNRSLADFLAIDKSMLLGKNIKDMVMAEDSRRVAEAVVHAQTAPAAVEVDLLREAGLMPVYLSFSPIEIDDWPCIALVVTDLSAQKRSDKIAAKEEFVRRILDQAAEPIIVCDSEGVISHASLVAQWYCTSNPIGRHFDQAFPLRQPRESEDKERSELHSDEESDDILHEPVREMLCRDGVVRSFIVNESPLRNGVNAIIGRIITLSDVTERNKVEKARTQAKAALRQSEARFRAALANSQVTVFEKDLELHYTWMHNPKVGGPAEELIGKRSGDIMDAESAAEYDAIMQQVIHTGLPDRKEVRITANGELVAWVDLYVEARRNERGDITGVVCTAVDITERKKTEEELELASLVYKESAEAMMVTDAENRIIAVNPAFEYISGYKATEIIGRSPLILSSGRHNKAHYREMIDLLSQNNYWQGELWLRKKNGEEFAAAMTINTTFHADGSVNRHVALFADVTKKKEAEELVWHQANYDALTGLPNRRHFQDQLRSEVKKSRRSRLPLALMFLDLDGFKNVNDTVGHDMGDMLLKLAAERLSGCVRESDTVARLGGDEFTVILSELTNLRQVSSIAQHILSTLSEPFQLGEEVAHVSASIGITLYPQDASTVDELLVNADQAMYAAKQEGKNRYHYFTQALQEASQERMWLVNELRLAIDNKQFKLAYQPIVELSTGCINKAEALLRWEHPVRGLIDPSLFIPVAEETGMIREIGDWVFFEAANQVARWRQTHHPDFQISINKSPVQFKARTGDLSFLFDHLKSLNLPGQAIAVEITEGVLMDESKVVTDQLLAFRDEGIEVSLDDFGTGYSTLSYLKRFDIDRLKIDQSFIRDLETNQNDQALCEAMIVMAHKLGIKVIAEGVETPGQRNLLMNAECDFVQGYLLSTPVSAEELDDLLRRGAIYCPGVPPGHLDRLSLH